MMMSLEEYKTYFGWGYSFWFRDCVVRTKDLFVLALRRFMWRWPVEWVAREARQGDLRI